MAGSALNMKTDHHLRAAVKSSPVPREGGRKRHVRSTPIAGSPGDTTGSACPGHGHREGAMAPFRDLDDPVRGGRRGAGRADRDGIDRRVDLGVGQRLRGHLDRVAWHRVRAVRQHRRAGWRYPARGSRLGDQERHLAEPGPERHGRPVHAGPARWHRIDPGVRRQPRGRRRPAQRQRDLHQHRDRPGRRDPDRGARHLRQLGRFRRAGGPDRHHQPAAAHLADHGGHVHPARPQPRLQPLRLLAVAVSGNAGYGAADVSRRAAFRGWRRTRPFWGGFLLVLAGVELLLIPLSGILVHGAVRLVVYIGIGGVFGVLLGVLLIACGLLLWLNPAHRTFYAIAGVLLAVLSFIASNFGGFFIGMLLGIIGGSMGFGWTPAADRAARRLPHPSRDGGRVLAVAVLPLLLASTAGHQAAQDTTPPPQQDCILGLLCLPAPSPSPTPAAGQPSSAGPGAGAPSSTPGPGSAPQPGRSAGPGADGRSRSRVAAGPSGVEASTATSVIVAGSATLDGLSYQGTAQVPTASGTVTMMKFTMSSLTLTEGVRATVTQDSQTTVTTNSSLDFSGGVVLYAARLSGSLLGVPLTLTPGNVVTVLLNLLNSLTPLVPVTLTDVTTDDFLVASDSLQASDLTITSG